MNDFLFFSFIVNDKTKVDPDEPVSVLETKWGSQNPNLRRITEFGTSSSR